MNGLYQILKAERETSEVIYSQTSFEVEGYGCPCLEIWVSPTPLRVTLASTVLSELFKLLALVQSP
jgi:hypothetical protein